LLPRAAENPADAPRMRMTEQPIATPLVIGVTSHRDLVGAEVEPIRERIRALIAELAIAFPDMPLVVLSSLAAGGDQLVAEEALRAGARLVAALPMARAEYARDFSDAATLARFESLCDAAEIIEVPRRPGFVRAHTSDTLEGHARDVRYAEAGIYVSDHCHLLLAIWDGKPSASLGGTAQTVSYHLTGVRPTEQRRSGRRSALGYGSDRLAYHIVASRDRPDGTPLASLHALDARWRTGDAISPVGASMPEAFRAMFSCADAFNLDSAKYAAGIEAYGGADTSRPGSRRDALDALFRAADWLAMHFQRRVVLAMRVLYTVAALMAIAFTVYDNVPSQDNMLYVFLLLFVIGGFIVTLANRRGWHRKYLDYRALAEGLRVQSYWRRAGIPLTDDTEFARDNFLQKQDVELGWVRNVMRGAALDDGDGVADPAAFARVVAEWIGDGERQGQLEYYRRKAAQRARTHRVTEAIGIASLCVGIGISVVLAIFARQLSPDAKNALVMVMAVFSIVAGVRAAYAYKKADKELIKQYRYMQQIFDQARIALKGTDDAREQREILRLLGEAALAEQVEWALMHRQRPLEHNRI
jgi:hypothetical protein